MWTYPTAYFVKFCIKCHYFVKKISLFCENISLYRKIIWLFRKNKSLFCEKNILPEYLIILQNMSLFHEKYVVSNKGRKLKV